MKDQQHESALSRHEMKVASFMITHLCEKHSENQNCSASVAEIKLRMPERMASLKTVRSIAEKSQLFHLSDTEISLAANEISATVTYTATGATRLVVDSAEWNNTGGTRSVQLRLPGYWFDVTAETANPLTQWQFTVSNIITILGQTRTQSGNTGGRGPSRSTVNTI